MSRWRTVTIFVSSTFRDMHEERDILNKRVFPELAERLRARAHHLETIDLRWGVDTADLDEDARRELQVLKVCLKEIDRSTPYMLGLIGDRYGWQPPRDRLQAAIREAGYVRPSFDCSVTELEIAYGVLDNPRQHRRCRFYMRAPLPYDAMTRECAAAYSDAHHGDNDRARAVERLRILKARIAAHCPDRVHRYRAEWDSNRCVVCGLGEWGRRVLEDLWSDLQIETEAHLREPPSTWYEQEQLLLEECIETSTRAFAGRQAIAERLMTFAATATREDASWAVAVTAPVGTGKTSLFGHLCRLLEATRDVDLMQVDGVSDRGETILILAHAAGISARSRQVDVMLRRFVATLSASLGEENPVADTASLAEVERAFAELLERASAHRRVVVLIDALDEFEPSRRALNVTWLPRVWPRNARLIVTAAPGEANRTIRELPGVTECELPPADPEEALEILSAVCKRQHRELNTRVSHALLDKRTSAGVRAAGNLLWLTVAAEELSLLDADDFARSEQEFDGTPEARLLQLVVAAAEELPGDLDALFERVLERSEELTPAGFAQGVCSLVAMSRDGWRQADFEALISKTARTDWDGLAFATFRRTLGGQFVQRGLGGRWDVPNAALRQCIATRYGAGAARVHDMLKAVSDYLCTLPLRDEVRQTEFMYYLIMRSDYTLAARCLVGETPGMGCDVVDVGVELVRKLDERGEAAALSDFAAHLSQFFQAYRARSELAHHTAINGPEFILALLKQRARPSGELFSLCQISWATAEGSPNDMARVLLQATRESLEWLVAHMNSDARQKDQRPLWKRALGLVNAAWARALDASGDVLGATLALESAKMILDDLSALPDLDALYPQLSSTIASDRWQVYSQLGRAMLHLEMPVEALSLLREARLGIESQLASGDKQPWLRCDLCMTERIIGDAEFAQGNMAAALASYQAARRIAVVECEGARVKESLRWCEYWIREVVQCALREAAAVRDLSGDDASSAIAQEALSVVEACWPLVKGCSDVEVARGLLAKLVKRRGIQ